MRAEYDFDYSKAERGKYTKRLLKEGSNVVVLDRDVERVAGMKRTRGSDNIFKDLGFPPGEAESLKMRSELMIGIETFCRRSRLTQAQAAKRLGITQPRLNALLKGRIGLFSLDALVNIASRAGLKVRLVIRKAA
jgi:predicted XRE-type DNA-binding protein